MQSNLWTLPMVANNKRLYYSKRNINGFERLVSLWRLSKSFVTVFTALETMFEQFSVDICPLEVLHIWINNALQANRFNRFTLYEHKNSNSNFISKFVHSLRRSATLSLNPVSDVPNDYLRRDPSQFNWIKQIELSVKNHSNYGCDELILSLYFKLTHNSLKNTKLFDRWLRFMSNA